MDWSPHPPQAYIVTYSLHLRTCTVLYQVHVSHGLLPYPLVVSMQFSDVTSVSN